MRTLFLILVALLVLLLLLLLLLGLWVTGHSDWLLFMGHWLHALKHGLAWSIMFKVTLDKCNMHKTHGLLVVKHVQRHWD